MSFNYHEDEIAQACLVEAAKSKAQVAFGAVLIKTGEIIGYGRNRRAIKKDRKLLTHVDYAIHAEQDCVVSALKNGFKKTELRDLELKIYVIGIIKIGHHKGTLTIRRKKEFICRKCPPSVLLPFNIPVCIPHTSGWVELSPEKAAKTGKQTAHKGRWKQFVETGNIELNNRWY